MYIVKIGDFMKKNIIYGVLFFLIVLAGSFSFYIYYQESYFSIDERLVSITVDNDYWTASNVKVTVEYKNEDIPIGGYSFDGGKTWQFSNEYEVEENQRLEIVLKTETGRKSEIIPYAVSNIDKQAPEILVDNVIYVAQGSRFNFEDKYSVVDLDSGIKGSVTVKPNWIDTSDLATYQVEISASDKALNSNAKTMVVEVVDPNDPLLSEQNPDVEIRVQGVNLSETRLSLVKGTNTKVEAIIRPSNATNKNVVWTSSNESVATVDQTGNITALEAGMATITATTQDGNKSSDIRLVVTDRKIEVEKIELDRVSDTVTSDFDDIVLTATISPENATDTKITWNSSNPNVAVVVNGVVTVRGEGVTNLTATTSNGKVATYTLTVVDSYTYQEKEVTTFTGDLMGYTIKIYKNGVDITSDVTAITSPFVARNDYKAPEIEISIANHNALQDGELSFNYKTRKLVATK